jgi:hypothetical protein
MITTKEEPLARYGHSAVLYKKEIYIYGGVTDNSNYVREDIVIYDIEKKKFKLEEKTSNKLYFKWRRNHTAEIVGHHMVVYGGIDDDENVLDDVWTLDLNFTLKWSNLDIKGPRHKPLAHHCSALILPFEKRNNSQMSIFKFPDFPSGRTTIKGCKIEGIAYFGGIDHEGNINDELRILKVGKKTLEWFIPTVKGDIPEGMKNASLNYYEPLNVLILFGGENVRQEFSNYLHFLDLESFKWVKISLYESIPLERSSHCCVLFQHQLIIFGGLNAEKYVGSNIYIINLDIIDKKTKQINISHKKVYLSKDDIGKNY